MSEQDIDKLLKVGNAINKLVKTGELIAKDGINTQDIIHAPALYSNAKELYEAAKEYQEIIEEIKDIDGIEAIQFVNEVFLK